MHEPDLIDHYVFHLWRRLSVSRETAERILEEVEGHLRATAEREARSGLSAEDAQRRAIGSFGAVEDVSARLVDAYRPRRLGRVLENWSRMHPLDRLALVFVVLVVPWNLNLLRGGAEIGMPLGTGAFLSGLLSGYLSERHGRSLGAALSALIVAYVLSFAVAVALHQHPIRDMWSAFAFAVDTLPMAFLVLGFAAVGIVGSAAGRRLRRGSHRPAQSAITA